MLKSFKLSRIQALIPVRGALVRKEPAPLEPVQAPPSEFVTLRPLRPGSYTAGYDLYGGVPRRRRWFDLDGALGRGLIIGLPTLCAILYFGLIAADRYVSESEFVVRNTEQPAAGRLASMVSAQAGGAAATGGVGGDSDSHVVVTFMKSHDGMNAVDRALDLRKLFTRSEADVLAAFPGPFRGDTEYRLNEYFSRMVSVDYNSATGVIKLTTEAFRPEDAKAIGDQLLAGAEALVNRIDARAQQEAIRAAAEQVAAAHKDVVEAQAKLTAFRIREKMIDPVAMSGVVLETIATLAAKSVAMKAQLSDLAKNAPASGQAGVLRNQIAAVEEQIAAQQRQLAGPDGSMTPVLAEYQQLSLQLEFANRIYAAALEQAESARVEASRQHIFIERISGPTLADYATQPRRLLLTLLTIAIALSVFGVVRFVIRDSRVHHGR